MTRRTPPNFTRDEAAATATTLTPGLVQLSFIWILSPAAAFAAQLLTSQRVDNMDGGE